VTRIASAGMKVLRLRTSISLISMHTSVSRSVGTKRSAPRIVRIPQTNAAKLAYEPSAGRGVFSGFRRCFGTSRLRQSSMNIRTASERLGTSLRLAQSRMAACVSSGTLTYISGLCPVAGRPGGFFCCDVTLFLSDINP
jgi:hypothetical protein